MAWVGTALGAVSSWWGGLSAGTQAAIGAGAGAAASAGTAKYTADKQEEALDKQLASDKKDRQSQQQQAAMQQASQRRRAVNDAQTRSGRASTFLTDQSGTLG